MDTVVPSQEAALEELRELWRRDSGESRYGGDDLQEELSHYFRNSLSVAGLKLTLISEGSFPPGELAEEYEKIRRMLMVAQQVGSFLLDERRRLINAKWV